MAEVINGKQVAASVIDAVKTASQTLKDEIGVKTGLAVSSSETVRQAVLTYAPRARWQMVGKRVAAYASR